VLAREGMTRGSAPGPSRQQKNLILPVPSTTSALEEWCRECCQAPAALRFSAITDLRRLPPVAMALGEGPRVRASTVHPLR